MQSETVGGEGGKEGGANLRIGGEGGKEGGANLKTGDANEINIKWLPLILQYIHVHVYDLHVHHIHVYVLQNNVQYVP